MRSTKPVKSLRVAVMLVIILAACSPTLAHVHTRALPDDQTFDQGLLVLLRHPAVIRTPHTFDFGVVVSNLGGESPATITNIAYTVDHARRSVEHSFKHELPGRRGIYDDARRMQHDLDHLDRSRNRARVEQLLSQRAEHRAKMMDGALADRITIDAGAIPIMIGATLDIDVVITAQINGVPQTIQRSVSIPIRAPLPDGAAPARRAHIDAATGRLTDLGTMTSTHEVRSALWRAGDQHLHTRYSLDGYILDGTRENVADYAAVAETIGLSWIIITDHSNVHYTQDGEDFYTQAQFDAGTAEAAAYRAANNYLVLYGEEMGAGEAGFWDLPSHVLAHPYTVDSTGFLENPSSGLIYGMANCESEQTILNRINTAGGIAFVAHPFDSGTLAFAEWDFNNGATGWAGMEIFSDEDGELKGTDQEAIDKWHDLLGDIAPPTLGALVDRPGFHSPFPVGIGNSDAHVPGKIGATFTYALIEDTQRSTVMNALASGRCIASNGPLVYGDIASATSGGVAVLREVNPSLDVHLETTAEFGPVGDYTITIFVNGAVRATIAPTGLPDYAAVYTVDNLNLVEGDTFITLRADNTAGTRHGIANPIWLQYSCPWDVAPDGTVGLGDLNALLSNWGPCPAPPADCPWDFAPPEGDDVVGLGDLNAMLSHWGPCP